MYLSACAANEKRSWTVSVNSTHTDTDTNRHTRTHIHIQTHTHTHTHTCDVDSRRRLGRNSACTDRVVMRDQLTAEESKKRKHKHAETKYIHTKKHNNTGTDNTQTTHKDAPKQRQVALIFVPTLYLSQQCTWSEKQSLTTNAMHAVVFTHRL